MSELRFKNGREQKRSRQPETVDYREPASAYSGVGEGPAVGTSRYLDLGFGEAPPTDGCPDGVTDLQRM